MNRARSLVRPKASRWFIHWAMLPGKITTKKAASTHPTTTRRLASRINAEPRAISTAPEASTVTSGGTGTHVGTCAWNSSRANVRWPMPAITMIAPSAIRPIF